MIKRSITSLRKKTNTMKMIGDLLAVLVDFCVYYWQNK